MRIKKVRGFSGLPDGRLRAGPFVGPVSAIERRFSAFGIRPGDDDHDRVVASLHAQGVVISCTGPGVRGYLLDADGIEVSSSDLEALLDILLPRRGGACRISGHYRLEPGHMIESDALFWRGLRGIEGSERRERVASDGTRKVIRAGVINPDPALDRMVAV